MFEVVIEYPNGTLVRLFDDETSAREFASTVDDPNADVYIYINGELV